MNFSSTLKTKRSPSQKSARCTASSIGTKKESSLHRSLKIRYSGSGGAIETLAGAYVCDACTSEGELIEVQTGSFGPLKEKAPALCRKNKVRIIYPVISKKHIELYNTDGKLLHKRKSPKKGVVWDLFTALIHAPELPLLKNLTIELALIDVVEKRIDDGGGSWWRKGVRTADRFLDAWRHSVVLTKPRDYYQFIPFGKNERFTARDLAKKAGIDARLAQKTLYVLTKMGLTECVGKQGRAFVYHLKVIKAR